MDINDDELKIINELRVGEHYSDCDAAKELNGTSEKAALECSPFVIFFDLGKAKSGYWRYEHMVIQLEDCVDCLRVKFKGADEGEKFKYDFLFEFDHSSGHSKQRPDGLSVADGHVNIGVGGKAALMRPSVLTANCLGDCLDRTLNIGDIATHVFGPMEPLPICHPGMPQYDTPDPVGLAKTKKKNVDELKAELIRKGHSNLALGRAELIRDHARRKGIELERVECPMILGYVGKAKGLKQIAFERGLFPRE